VMAVVRERLLQALAVPRRITRRPEEYRTLVVVDAVHDGASCGKIRTHFRADEPGRAGHEARRRAHNVKRSRSVADEWEARIMRFEKRRPIVNRVVTKPVLSLIERPRQSNRRDQHQRHNETHLRRQDDDGNRAMIRTPQIPRPQAGTIKRVNRPSGARQRPEPIERRSS